MAISAALAATACDVGEADTPLRQPDNPTVTITEALAIQADLTGRLDAQGVTLGDLDRAIQAGDEDAIQAFFGLTDDEVDALFARILLIAESLEPVGAPLLAPRSDWCDGEVAACMGAAALTASKYPGKIGIAIYAVGGLMCGWRFCRPGR